MDLDEGYFVFETALPLDLVQAYLGPHTSVQSFTHQGLEGSLVASPDPWTKVSHILPVRE